jgi:predicted O-methyltransferase YrrM
MPEATLTDIHAWPALAPLAGEYLPWSSATLRPSALVLLLNDVLVLGRETLVECGGGVSTLYFARLLARIGTGRLVTLEHDPRWSAFLLEALAREGLGDRATVVDAPLAVETGWYDAAAVATALPDLPIDLLLVDGPPAVEPGREQARHEALPALYDHLAPDATIALDDVARAGEQAVLARWEAEFGLRFEQFEAEGIAVARIGGESPLRP